MNLANAQHYNCLTLASVGLEPTYLALSAKALVHSATKPDGQKAGEITSFPLVQLTSCNVIFLSL